LRWSTRPFLPIAIWLALLAADVSVTGAFTITPTFSGNSWTVPQQFVVYQAITDWTSRLQFPDGNHQDIPITFQLTPVGTQSGAFLAQWQYQGDIPVPHPYSLDIAHIIVINSSFQSVESYSLQGPVVGQYDMLSAIRHELGHALGFVADAYTDNTWLQHVAGGTFDPGGLNVPIMEDCAHVNNSTDLMYYALPTGVRRDISDTDVAMLSLGYGYTVVLAPEPASFYLLALPAFFLFSRSRRSPRGAAPGLLSIVRTSYCVNALG
jgi:hypothetical protein